MGGHYRGGVISIILEVEIVNRIKVEAPTVSHTEVELVAIASVKRLHAQAQQQQTIQVKPPVCVEPQKQEATSIQV